MEIYFFSSAILFIAGIIAGLAGFGAVLLSIPLLAIFLDIKTVIPITGLAALTTHGIILFQLRNHFDFKKIKPLILGSLPGIIIGVMMLKFAKKEFIQIFLGTTLLVYSLYILIGKKNYGYTPKFLPYIFGMVSGILGGSIGASGPPIVVYTSLQSWSKHVVKVTIQGYFILSGLLIVAGHGLAGLITLSVLKIFCVGLPALILGTYIGSIFYNLSREEDYRRVVLYILAALGLLMLYRGFY